MKEMKINKAKAHEMVTSNVGRKLLEEGFAVLVDGGFSTVKKIKEGAITRYLWKF